MSDEELMSKLKGAAPAEVLDHATILNMAPDDKMTSCGRAITGGRAWIRAERLCVATGARWSGQKRGRKKQRLRKNSAFSTCYEATSTCYEATTAPVIRIRLPLQKRLIRIG